MAACDSVLTSYTVGAGVGTKAMLSLVDSRSLSVSSSSVVDIQFSVLFFGVLAAAGSRASRGRRRISGMGASASGVESASLGAFGSTASSSSSGARIASHGVIFSSSSGARIASHGVSSSSSSSVDRSSAISGTSAGSSRRSSSSSSSSSTSSSTESKTISISPEGEFQSG